jgi:hypothetical protein
VVNSSDVCWEKAARPQQNQVRKSVILNGRQLLLKECATCGDDFYGIAKQTRCNECLANRMKRAS